VSQRKNDVLSDPGFLSSDDSVQIEGLVSRILSKITVRQVGRVLGSEQSYSEVDSLNSSSAPE